jgi:hypothetical protein
MNASLAAPSVRLVAADPRADNGQREISISAEAVAIERRVSGVRMHVFVPAPSFRGVALSVSQGPRGFVYRVALVHADADLDIVLAETPNEADIGREWLAWADYFGLPRLIRNAGGETVVERRYGPVEAFAVKPRRRGWPLKNRRSMMSARRLCPKAGAAAVHRGEREIVCYE